MSFLLYKTYLGKMLKSKRVLAFVMLGKPFSGTLITASIIAFAFFTSSLLEIPLQPRFLLLIAAATVFCGKFICIHNDIIDYECDCKEDKKANKPLVSGMLTIKDAWHYAILTLFLSLFLAALVTSDFLVVIAALLFNGFFYNTWGKPKGHLFGNLQVSIATAFVVPMGAMIVMQGRFEPMIILLLLPCFIIAFAYETFRQIANATMDLQGDSAGGYRTLPTVVGEWKAIIIGWCFLVFGLCFLLSTLHYGWGVLYSTGVVFISVLAVAGAFRHAYVLQRVKDTDKKRKFEVWYRHYLRISILIFVAFVLLEGLF